MGKAMKKLLSLFMCVVLLCGIFCGCGNSSQANMDGAAQAYIDMAQEYINNGNYASAIDVLNKGYSSTNDERIHALLQDVLSKQSAYLATSTTAPVTTAVTTTKTATTTTPATTTVTATTPATTTATTTTPATTTVTTTTPTTTVATTTTLPNSPTFLNTHSGTISISTANISLQDSAVLYVTVSYAGSVSYSCESSDIVTLTWGEFDYNSTVPLYITALKNGTTCIRIYETDYPYNYLTVNVSVSNHVVTDPSKASGILANMGLTEQGFRDICTYIDSRYYKDNAYVYAIGREYYAQHPEENILLDTYTEEWYEYCAFGRDADSYASYNEYELQNSNSLDDYLNFKLYGPKGASLVGDWSENIFKEMQEYPDNYINQPFLLKHFRTTYINNYTYTDDCYILYNADISVVDYRDNVNHPNILQGIRYDMYVIFLGTNGVDNLVFALISAEKCP